MAEYSEHLQRYGVMFDTASDLITVGEAHSNLVVEYGSTITAPELFGIPEGVLLEGWFDKNDNL
jgi:hypothetical protein